MSAPRVTRREILAGTVAAGLCAVSVPARAGALGANERVRIGLVGAGYRGMELLDALSRVARGARGELVGVCDLWRLRRETACARVREQTGREPSAWRHLDELIEAGRCDAVILATPDVSHASLCAKAVRAGLDVYVEAPLAHTLTDAAAVLEVCRASGRVVQVGTQARSDARWMEFARFAAAGELAITAIEASCRGIGRLWRRPGWMEQLRAGDVEWDHFLPARPGGPFDLRRYVHFRHDAALSAGLAGRVAQSCARPGEPADRRRRADGVCGQRCGLRLAGRAPESGYDRRTPGLCRARCRAARARDVPGDAGRPEL